MTSTEKATTPNEAKVCPEKQKKYIDTAAKFLEDPDLAKISRVEKLTFLKEKGLSKEVIDRAFEIYDRRAQILEFDRRSRAEAARSKEYFEKSECAKR